jgi:tryptophan-rich sensory protein
MMAVAAWLVWRRGGSEAQPALRIFALQLGLNVLWSVLFFGLRLPGVAFAEIIFLWLAIGVTARVFGRISTSAGLLFVPYFVWVGFAAILNFAIWRLNA